MSTDKRVDVEVFCPYNHGMETKRGRPALPEGERAEERMELRVKPADKESWLTAAERAGMSLSAWIRDRLNKAAKR